MVIQINMMKLLTGTAIATMGAGVLADNGKAAVLALAALILSIGVRRDAAKSLSRTGRASGEARAESVPPRSTGTCHKHGDDAMNNERVNRVSAKLCELVHGTLMPAAVVVLKGDGPPAAVEVCSQVALTAMMLAAPILANVQRVHDTNDVTDEFAETQMKKALRPEVLAFIGLHSALLLDDVKIDSEENGIGVERLTSTDPSKLWMALEAWQKVYPDKSADDYFEPKMLEAARNAGKNSALPFADFLAKRAQAHGGSNSIN